MTAESRAEVSKQCAAAGEIARIGVRKVRGVVVKRIRKMTNNSTDEELESISEEDSRVATKQMQTMHDAAIARVDAAVKQKQVAVEDASS